MGIQSLFWSVGSILSIAAAQQVCNGYSEYCSQRYSQLSYTGAHDSAFIRTSAENSLFGNQFYSVTTQLNSGVRMLQSQVHSSDTTNSSSGIELCHTACNYPGSDFGPLETYLTDVKTWLDANPNEVITILWVNGGFDPTVWQQAYTSTGLLQYVYTPSVTTQGILTLNDWPTLGELISANTRVINFMDAGANFATVPWLLDEFSNVWETSYDVTDAAGFQCTLDRPYASQYQSSIAASQKLYLINHFLDYELGTTGIDIPNVTYASVTNSVSDRVGSLSSQVTNCTTLNGRKPNFFLVDFFDQGNGSSVAAAAIANGVQYRPSSGYPGPFAVPGSENYTSTYNTSGSNSSASASSVASSSRVSSTQAPGAVVSGSGPRTLASDSSIASVASSATVGTSQTTGSIVPSSTSSSSGSAPTSSTSATKSNANVSASSSALGLLLTTVLSTLATTSTTSASSGTSVTSPATKSSSTNAGTTSQSALSSASNSSFASTSTNTVPIAATTISTSTTATTTSSTSTILVGPPASPTFTTVSIQSTIPNVVTSRTIIASLATTTPAVLSTTSTTTSIGGTALVGAVFFSSTTPSVVTTPVSTATASLVGTSTAAVVSSVTSTLTTSIIPNPTTSLVTSSSSSTKPSSTIFNAATSTALPVSTSGTTKIMASSSFTSLLGTICALSLLISFS